MAGKSPPSSLRSVITFTGEPNMATEIEKFNLVVNKLFEVIEKEFELLKSSQSFMEQIFDTIQEELRPSADKYLDAYSTAIKAIEDAIKPLHKIIKATRRN
jgi:malonyl CoA-acyl carrier protein transacylase